MLDFRSIREFVALVREELVFGLPELFLICIN